MYVKVPGTVAEFFILGLIVKKRAKRVNRETCGTSNPGQLNTSDNVETAPENLNMKGEVLDI